MSLPTQKPKASLDRLPPYSLEAEQGILSCTLQDPATCIPQCIERIRRPSVFYDLRHQTIYELLLKMWDEQRPIDMITVQQALKDAGQLESIGGLVYLNEITDAAPSALNLSYYIEIVHNKFVRRRAIQAATAIVSHVWDDETTETDAVLDFAERQVMDIGQERFREDDKSIKSLVGNALGMMEQMHQNQGKVMGLPTGFSDLDKMTAGLEPGQMVVIAARPSMGKTSLAINIAEHVAIDLGLSVGVFSLEMTADSLVMRMLCSRARINLRNLRDGILTERDFPRITGVAGKLSKAPIHIDDSSGLSILQLRAKARRMHQQHGLKLLIIDYLQLLNSSNRRAENRQQEIADISGGVKALAKELNIPVIVLSQLNRDIEKDKGRRPRLSDLRESGAIEQDADIVGLLYKPASDDDEAVCDGDAQSINLYIAKQRNGPTGDVNLTFLRAYTRFESAARVSAEDAAYSQHND